MLLRALLAWRLRDECIVATRNGALARTLSAAVRVRAIASEKTEVVLRVKLARVSVEAGFDGYRLLQCWPGEISTQYYSRRAHSADTTC